MTHLATNDRSTATAARKKAKRAYGVEGGTGDVNRLAIVILEVLAGMRTPPEAAQVLGMSLARYYQLERRAVEGLVAGCEARPKGKQPSPQGQIARLQRELEHLRRQCTRQQALVRAAQRSIGLKSVPAQNPKEAAASPRDRRGRRKRRPTVRALRVADALRSKDRIPDDQTVKHESRTAGQVEERPEEVKTASC